METLSATTNRYETGFTLLEVMVALAIMAIAIVAIFQLQAQTAILTGETQFQTVAPLLAQKKMTEIETGVIKDPTEGSGDFGEAFPGYQWRYSVSEVESEVLGQIAEDLKRIDLTVSSQGEENVYTVRAYRFMLPKD